MLQDDLALTEVVKSLSEQLQQVQSQQAEQQATIREQQATIAEQARQIGALTKNVAKQDEQIDRLTDNFARLEAEHKVIASLQDNGNRCCMSAIIIPFSIVTFLAKYFKFNLIARSLYFIC